MSNSNANVDALVLRMQRDLPKTIVHSTEALRSWFAHSGAAPRILANSTRNERGKMELLKQTLAADAGYFLDMIGVDTDIRENMASRPYAEVHEEYIREAARQGVVRGLRRFVAHGGASGMEGRKERWNLSVENDAKLRKLSKMNDRLAALKKARAYFGLNLNQAGKFDDAGFDASREYTFHAVRKNAQAQKKALKNREKNTNMKIYRNMLAAAGSNGPRTEEEEHALEVAKIRANHAVRSRMPKILRVKSFFGVRSPKDVRTMKEWANARIAAANAGNAINRRNANVVNKNKNKRAGNGNGSTRGRMNRNPSLEVFRM